VSLGKRYAYPNEIADLINFLLSSKSSFITGQTIVIDGGFTLTK
jgi:NAD(P)-dependent dehydrogenase (short-subunit alcohol dehydrogenase family)